MQTIDIDPPVISGVKPCNAVRLPAPANDNPPLSFPFVEAVDASSSPLTALIKPDMPVLQFGSGRAGTAGCPTLPFAAPVVANDNEPSAAR